MHTEEDTREGTKYQAQPSVIVYIRMLERGVSAHAANMIQIRGSLSAAPFRVRFLWLHLSSALVECIAEKLHHHQGYVYSSYDWQLP
jgi:hypothetical protein